MEKRYTQGYQHGYKVIDLGPQRRAQIQKEAPDILWKELHTRALKTKGNDSAYLAKFAARIPRYISGCKCKENWYRWVKTNPPTFGEKYFEWTVLSHNDINKRLGKPIMSIETARRLYL